MYPFWSTITQPLLVAARPKMIAEVGSEAGLNLQQLLSYATAGDAVVHAIDPKPLFDVGQWTRAAAGRLVVHRDVSLKVLPQLAACDVLFLDGDHNWYTVYHELKAVEERHRALDRGFPLVLAHDIGWPWGRRDLYYDPQSIPAEFRQPCGRPPPPTQAVGYHADFYRAHHEGGPRNGVLTAVEDFIAQSATPIELTNLPGFAGLGILLPRWMAEARPEVANLVREISPSPALRKYIEELEEYRMRRRGPPRAAAPQKS